MTRFPFAKRKSPFRERGTDGSNPPPSSGESGANPTRHPLRAAFHAPTPVSIAARQPGILAGLDATLRPRQSSRTNASSAVGLGPQRTNNDEHRQDERHASSGSTRDRVRVPRVHGGSTIFQRKWWR